MVTTLVLMLLGFSWVAPVRAYTLQYADAAATVRIKWPSGKIRIALSASLNSPPANIKAGSDILGAVRRALARWSEAANVQFIETSTDALSISPSGGGDHISLITVADTSENRAVFQSAERTGRTRIFYDPATGEITEADVALNPATPFSTDGTPGTYDIEATLTHEIGHVLGLEHSAEVGAAMQARQGTNGLYEQAALSPRTLSDDDRAGARALYGPRENFGVISGTIADASGKPAAGAHVWAEDVSTGRVVAGSLALPNGSYSIEGLPAGRYRLVSEYAEGGARGADAGFAQAALSVQEDLSGSLRTVELRQELGVSAGAAVRQDVAIGQGNITSLRPQVIGTGGHLSTVAVPVVQGRRYTIFIGGRGVDQIAGDHISVTSPFIKVNAASLTLQSGLNYQHPIISFDVEVAAEAPLGDYSIRLESRTGEVAYISGALTIDSAAGALDPISVPNLVSGIFKAVGNRQEAVATR